MSGAIKNLAGAFALTVIIVILVAGSALKSKTAGFASDTPYINQLFAESIAQSGVYGVAGSAKPVLREGLWRWMAGWLSHVTGAAPAKLFTVLSVACTLIMAGLLLRSVSRWYPGQSALIWVTGVLVALSPPMTLWAVNGSSASLGAMLVAAAFLFHIAGVATNRPLPLGAALCLGFAACIRLEFLAVWIAFMIHGIAVSVFTPRGVISTCATFIRGLSGLVVAAICVAPLVGWNVRVVGVPWPAFTDAPLTLDALSGTDTGPFAAALSNVMASLSGAYGMWSESLYASGWIEKLFALIGCAYWSLRAETGRKAIFAGIAIVLASIPLVHALLVPVLGWSGGVALYQSITPLWIMGVVAGIAAIQSAVDPLLARIAPAMSIPLRHIVIVLLAATAPMLEGYLKGRHSVAVDRSDSESAALIADSLRPDNVSGAVVPAVATDRPGRMIQECRCDVVDLGGELNPELLAALFDLSQLSGQLDEHSVKTLVIWDVRLAEAIQAVIPCRPVFEESAGFPFVFGL